MQKLLLLVALVAVLQGVSAQLRAPAVPLLVFDPYMSIWSGYDKLYEGATTSWFGKRESINGFIRVDGVVYNFMGAAIDRIPKCLNVTQLNVTVNPTQTWYIFSAGGVGLQVVFTTPFFPTDMDVMTRPVSYITFTASSVDGRSHLVQLLFLTTAEVAVNDVSEAVLWSRVSNSQLHIMNVGTRQQPVLQTSGDGISIDWGYLYLSAPSDSSSSSVMASWGSIVNTFMSTGTLPSNDDTAMPRAVSNHWPSLALSWKLTVAPGSQQTKYLMYAYDEVLSIEWFGVQMPPYWRHNYNTPVALLSKAASDYQSIFKAATVYDANLNKQTSGVGGSYYSALTSLIYRQTFGATVMVWNPTLNEPWFFMKEQSSCGCFHTVDVIFPASPQFMFLNPELLKLQIKPHLAYGNNETGVFYDKPFAQHHLGEYPIGYILPYQQEDMPMEESGNLIMMTAYIALHQKNDTSWFYPKYWPLLTQWANYLNSTLPFPPTQLCTNDFEGPTPNDTTLAAKGVIGLGAYSMLADMVGRHQQGVPYLQAARQFVVQWMNNAYIADPIGHYARQFGSPPSNKTWSIKFNLAWQKFLGLDLFPQSVFDDELDYYMTKINTYGVPMDDRNTYTMPPWMIMAACFTKTQAWERDAMVKLLFDYANDTPARVPLSDWFDTVTAKQIGFQGRPVNGALFSLMLC